MPAKGMGSPSGIFGHAVCRNTPRVNERTQLTQKQLAPAPTNWHQDHRPRPSPLNPSPQPSARVCGPQPSQPSPPVPSALSQRNGVCGGGGGGGWVGSGVVGCVRRPRLALWAMRKARACVCVCVCGWLWRGGRGYSLLLATHAARGSPALITDQDLFLCFGALPGSRVWLLGGVEPRQAGRSSSPPGC
jgi:hypothetical protein